jgi:hypothetical protein
MEGGGSCHATFSIDLPRQDNPQPANRTQSSFASQGRAAGLPRNVRLLRTVSSGKGFAGSLGRPTSKAKLWGMAQSRSFPDGGQIFPGRCNFWHELAIQCLGGEAGEEREVFAVKRIG